jgi:hypothetical protein
MCKGWTERGIATSELLDVVGARVAEENRGSWALVVHACNPSYSGGRDQEEFSSKPAWANCSRDPILKIFNTKQG